MVKDASISLLFSIIKLMIVVIFYHIGGAATGCIRAYSMFS